MARIGIIGSGWGERAQAPNFREAGLDVELFRGHNWRDAIRSKADLVTIVTPPSTHPEIALAALDAGKHVLCEKPTAVDATETEKLVAAARKHRDRITLIDHELRFVPAFQTARKRIGEIGAIRYAAVRYSSPSRGDRRGARN